MMGNCLDDHCLSCSRRTIQEYTSRREGKKKGGETGGLSRSRCKKGKKVKEKPGGVNSNLFVKIKVGQGKLDSLTKLLLLNIQSTNIRKRNVWALVLFQKSDTGRDYQLGYCYYS